MEGGGGSRTAAVRGRYARIQKATNSQNLFETPFPIIKLFIIQNYCKFRKHFCSVLNFINLHMQWVKIYWEIFREQEDCFNWQFS